VAKAGDGPCAVTGISPRRPGSVRPKHIRRANVLVLFRKSEKEPSTPTIRATRAYRSRPQRRQDPCIPLTLEAVEFWNRQLAELGTPFRLGTATETTDTLPTDYLTRLSAAVLKREPPPEVPERVDRMQGDLLIALSDGDFISFATWVRPGTKVMVGIRSDRRPPLSLPNVGRNVIAHELGHAIGLRHNDDPTTLICGRPAPCRPALFQSDVARFFPLTEADKGLLLRLYPPTWTPTQ
jgi:Dual-action HEIGH metallo-peptidase